MMLAENPAPPEFDPRCLERHVITRYRTKAGAVIELIRDGVGAFGYSITSGAFTSAGCASKTEAAAEEAGRAVLKMRGLI